MSLFWLLFFTRPKYRIGGDLTRLEVCEHAHLRFVLLTYIKCITALAPAVQVAVTVMNEFVLYHSFRLLFAIRQVAIGIILPVDPLTIYALC